MDVHVVPEAGFHADTGNARLSGVDFPGVEVEDGRHLINAIDAFNHPAREAVGHQAEVAAAAGWPVSFHEAQRGGRDFDQAADRMGMARGVGHAVVIVVDRVDAGAVAVTRFFPTFESPQIFFADRKTMWLIQNLTTLI